VKTENEMQRSQWHLGIWNLWCAAVPCLLYVMFHNIWWSCISITVPYNVWHASGAKIPHCGLSTGYIGFMISYFTFVIQNVFCILVDKRAHLAVKILYGNSWSNQYKSSGILYY